MRDLAELRLNDGGEPVARAAPTAEIISDFEATFGVVLPEGYLQLLSYSNGGYPELDSYVPPGASRASGWAINRFCHLDADRTSSDSIWTAMEAWRPVLGKDAVVFAQDGGGDPFFLDFKSSPPVVNVSMHDDRFKVVTIAPSFEAFINGLAIDPEMI